MNQILYNSVLEYSNTIPKKRNKFIIVFVFAVLLVIFSCIYYFFTKYSSIQNEKFSRHLVSNYNVMTLYSEDIKNYSINPILSLEKEDPFVIGLIQIDKINLIYPILSSVNENLLKISPCRFAGPMPNEIGNLCIAGHNYVDNKQFSKINQLKVNDIIKIFDLSGKSIDYNIYFIEEISYDDLTCTNQNTNNRKELTLITCNNVTGNRICIKAIEKIQNETQLY